MSARRLLDSFRAAGVLRPLDVHLGRALGQIAEERDPLVLLGVAAASRVHGAGHICLELGAFQDQVRDEAIEDAEVTWPNAAEWAAALTTSALVRPPDSEARTPLVLDGHRLYLDRYWGYQRRLITEVQRRLGDEKSDLSEASLRTGLDRLFPPVAGLEGEDLQRTAAETAAKRGFTIVTGGPGTGKTTTIKRLMALLIQDAWDRGEPTPRFALMAPTGKAAARMKESIREQDDPDPTSKKPRLLASDAVKDALPDQASTIHRALGFNPRYKTQFKRGAGHPLDADVVIVDEASMIDLALMVKLFEAVPRGARLILLGDADQLKSVEAGAILGDLCRALHTGVVTLTYTHRFGADSGIGALSRAIKGDQSSRALQLLRHEITEHPDGVTMYDELQWIPLEREDNVRLLKEAVARALRPIVLREMKPFHAAVADGDHAAALKAMDRFRVLAAHRLGNLGVQGLNRAIEQWLKQAKRIQPRRGSEFYVGRPIIVAQNDREQDLYNGDVGYIARDEAGSFVAVFPAPSDTPYRQVPVARLPPHQTVYAMTVHKSQGSQLSHALLALPLEPSRIITRELLYTGVTRAADRVTIIGHEDTLVHGIDAIVPRSSGLEEALGVAR
jgi:exodeoxyribonuclease V alpha subunit